MTPATMMWGRANVHGHGRFVLEVGSQEHNGSFREFVEPDAALYIGTDIAAGRGVDILCPADRLARLFGWCAFDLVICTELLEHVEDWRTVVRQLKLVTALGGQVALTTRLPGFPYHAYPGDFWRFRADDLAAMFSDCRILSLTENPADGGVYLLAERTSRFISEPPILKLARAS